MLVLEDHVRPHYLMYEPAPSPSGVHVPLGFLGDSAPEG